jgi:hypothetical protein
MIHYSEKPARIFIRLFSQVLIDKAGLFFIMLIREEKGEKICEQSCLSQPPFREGG